MWARLRAHGASSERAGYAGPCSGEDPGLPGSEYWVYPPVYLGYLPRYPRYTWCSVPGSTAAGYTGRDAARYPLQRLGSVLAGRHGPSGLDSLSGQP